MSFAAVYTFSTQGWADVSWCPHRQRPLSFLSSLCQLENYFPVLFAFLWFPLRLNAVSYLCWPLGGLPVYKASSRSVRSNLGNETLWEVPSLWMKALDSTLLPSHGHHISKPHAASPLWHPERALTAPLGVTQFLCPLPLIWCRWWGDSCSSSRTPIQLILSAKPSRGDSSSCITCPLCPYISTRVSLSNPPSRNGWSELYL